MPAKPECNPESLDLIRIVAAADVVGGADAGGVVAADDGGSFADVAAVVVAFDTSSDYCVVIALNDRHGIASNDLVSNAVAADTFDFLLDRLLRRTASFGGVSAWTSLRVYGKVKF